MQTRRLARGPGPWAPSLNATDPYGDSGFTNKAGPTNLDLKCQESLQKLLKPCNYPAITPWMREARASDKRDVVKLAELAAGGGSEVTHPISWLPPTQEKAVVNDRGRVRLAKTIPVTGDRVQSDLLKNRHGADVRDVALDKKRRFFANWAPVPSVNSVGDFFHLKDNPVATNPVAQILTESAKRGLHRWQVEGPEQSGGTSANVMKALRSLHGAVNRMPRYNEHVLDERLRSEGCRERLHDFAMSDAKINRSLMPVPYGRPDRYLHHSSSAPATLRPLIEPSEIGAIYRPGGYVVGLSDREPVQMLKNKERNQSSKIPFQGGSADFATSSTLVGQGHWDV
eukprot:TRINITY_DN56664_c0_g1_i1.p1 TRINITY_DN56664_c0_g1~~TRINITY_DN56664_c0_g1_i1.p1  ORF type:complete len:341 (-),score=44.74 TRINITY_DN56664_c0_g1_i1:216-1238(-)